MSSMPPSPVKVLWTSVQFPPVVEVCIEYAVAKAASQLSRTRVTGCTEPRSTVIHWGSLNWLDQRVPGLPSTAKFGVRLPASLLDEVAFLPWETSGPQVCTGWVGVGLGPDWPGGGAFAPPV